MSIYDDEYIDEAVTGKTHGHGAVVTKSVKLTQEQVDTIESSGEVVSQYIREAVQARIERGE